MAYKFEDLEVWQEALDYADLIHDIAEQLPKHERYNLSKDRGRQTADRRLLFLRTRRHLLESPIEFNDQLRSD